MQKSVLVVEDEERFGAMLVKALDRLGYRVSAVTTAEEALADDLALRADVVVTDIRLPGMDGFTFGKVLRTRLPTVRIIYMSGQFTDDKSDCTQLVASETLLKKPFTMQSLEASIRHLLDS